MSKQAGWGRRLAPIILCGLLSSQQSVQAQVLTQMLPERQSAETLQCLERPGGGPEYPAKDRQRRVGGGVRVHLVFEDAKAGPVVEVLARSASDEIVAAVQHFVASYRLPCLKGGQRVEAVQNFKFDAVGEEAGARVHPVTLPSVPGARWVDCLRTPSTKPALLQSGVDNLTQTRMQRRSSPKASNLIVHLRFAGMHRAPEVTVLYDSMTGRERASMLEYLQGYSLGCWPESRDEVVMEQQFHYQPSEVDEVVLQDMDLLQLLAAVKDIDKQRVSLDLHTMACPFKVHLRVGQPVQRNDVKELGRSDLNRIEFLRWLETLELNVAPDLFEQMLGQRFVVDVPCIVLNLEPS